MKDVTKETCEAYRPAQDSLWLIDFCLDALYRDRQHKFGDDINKYLTFEELMGTLLKARDDIKFYQKAEMEDELPTDDHETNFLVEAEKLVKQMEAALDFVTWSEMISVRKLLRDLVADIDSQLAEGNGTRVWRDL